MREIKVREFCISENKMYEVDLYSECLRKGDNFINMQSTNWKDINSVDVFDGDIVTCKFDSGKDCFSAEYLQVVFYVIGFTLMDRNNDIVDLHDFLSFSNGIKVVGNIHETPQLFSKEVKSE